MLTVVIQNNRMPSKYQSDEPYILCYISYRAQAMN